MTATRTFDACNEVTGCMYSPMDGDCDDGNPARPMIVRRWRVHWGTETVCDDGIACTVDSCDDSGECTFAPDDSFVGMKRVCRIDL